MYVTGFFYCLKKCMLKPEHSGTSFAVPWEEGAVECGTLLLYWLLQGGTCLLGMSAYLLLNLNKGLLFCICKVLLQL